MANRLDLMFYLMTSLDDEAADWRKKTSAEDQERMLHEWKQQMAAVYGVREECLAGPKP